MNILQPYIDILASFRKKRVLVIGEAILDVYLHGKSTRLCPEAPVPLVDVEDRAAFVGGSANTVCNFKALGATVDFLSVVGDDASGKEVKQILERKGISTRFLFTSSARTTLVKTRILSSGHVVSRYDAGSTEDISEELSDRLCGVMSRFHNHYDAIIFSDYGKGIITKALLDCVSEMQVANNLYIAIDSKRLQFFSGLTPSFIKPNYDEATKLLALSPTFKNRVAQLSDKGRELFRLTRSRTIALTLDSEGSLIYNSGELVYRASAGKVELAHVSGAGDTYLAAFVLSDLSDGDQVFSARIATAAATIAISKEYTSTCSNEELEKYFLADRKKIVVQEQLTDLCDGYRAMGKKIVFTNGCFDILHSGHVTYLQVAKDFGDVLIVGVNTDESIKRIKGHTRPINSLPDRMQVLEGLTCVTHIVPFGSEADDTPVPIIDIVKPDVFVKGGDYTKDMLPEAQTVEGYGGVIHFVPHVPDHSTTSIIKKINGDSARMNHMKNHGQLERL